MEPSIDEIHPPKLGTRPGEGKGASVGAGVEVSASVGCVLFYY